MYVNDVYVHESVQFRAMMLMALFRQFRRDSRNVLLNEMIHEYAKI